MPPPPKSLQEILKQRQRSDFVGREDYLSAFGDNLKLPLESPRRRFLFNVWGQGGVGKSTLLKQFSKAAQEGGAAVAYTDESETSLPEALGRLAEQFAQQGYSLSQFPERYRLYRQRKQELETDPEAPQGFSALVGKTVAKAGIKLGRRVPVGGAVLDFVDEDVLSTQAGEWASYVAKKLRNKDEVQLVRDPVTVLTPLFLQDLCTLAQWAAIALFFDTYEQIGEFLDSWLRQVLEGKHGDVPSNIVLTIAGRHALDSNHWVLYDDVTARFPLEPFTDEEAQQYLHRKGISDAKVMEVILHLSGRLPLLVATLAAGSPHSPDQVGEPSDTAVERFLKWVADPRQRQIALAAALPRRFNRDMIAELSMEEEADALFAWLKAMPFVKEQREGWVYHPVVRTLMLRYQRLSSPKGWKSAQGKLVRYFERCQHDLALEDHRLLYDVQWQNHALEKEYHGLCESPKNQPGQVEKHFLNIFSTIGIKQQGVFLFDWIEVVIQAGNDTENQVLKELGQKLFSGCIAFTTQEFYLATEMFSSILQISDLEPYLKATALTWRGFFHYVTGSYKDALVDFNESIRIQPNSELSLRKRGATHFLMDNYEEALKDLSRAIDLNPKNAFNFVIRSLCYQIVGNDENALADLNMAIEINPGNGSFIEQRALLHLHSGNLDESLANFSQAIQINSGNLSALIYRGKIYSRLNRYEEALLDFAEVIDINPAEIEAVISCAKIHYLLGHHEKALTNLNHVIELDPKQEWAIIYRGVTYRLMERYEEARTDFQKAIQLVQQDLQAQPDNVQRLFKLALYYLANNQFNLSKQTYQKGLVHGATHPQILAAVQDLSEFLKLFPGHPQATAFHNGLRKTLEAVPSIHGKTS